MIHKIYIDWSVGKPRPLTRCDDLHIGHRKKSHQWMDVTCKKCLEHVPEILTVPKLEAK